MNTENLFTPNCIRTYSGKYVNIFDPKPEMFCIEDIAHALSMQPRFSGHLRRFYSVAEHCINGCTMVGKKHKFAFLMHDASEAYLLDIPKPIKPHLSNYMEIEDNLMKVLSKVFGFEYPLSEEIKAVDLKMLHLEWNGLMIGGDHFGFMQYRQPKAKARFIDMFNNLNPSKP